MAIDQSLAQGMYNRMSRTVHGRMQRRLDMVMKQPQGRQRRSPWFRNRLNELRGIYRDTLLFETMTGKGKHRIARLFVLDIGDHQRGQVCCVEVRARTFELEHRALCLCINKHAMARVIQAKGGEDFADIRGTLGELTHVAMSTLEQVRGSIDTEYTLRIASAAGLSIWDVDAYDCDAGLGLTMKTFIGAEVLDGRNLKLYDELIGNESGPGYMTGRKRVKRA